MTAQDLVHCASHARMKLAKQIGHGMFVKYLTGSKQLVTLLNRMGYSSSYDEIEQVETCLANESFAKADVSAVIIPTNINPCAFIQMAADNEDINEETINSKNMTRATTFAVYPRKQYGPMPECLVHSDYSKKKRSLDSTRHLVVLEDANMGEDVLVYLKLSAPGSLVTASSSPPAWMTSIGCYYVFQILSWLATRCSTQKSRKYHDGVDSMPLHTLGSQ